MVPTVTRLLSLLTDRSGMNFIGRQKQSLPVAGSGHTDPLPERLVAAAFAGALGKSLSNTLRKRESEKRAAVVEHAMHSRMTGRKLRSILLTMYCSRVPKGLF